MKGFRLALKRAGIPPDEAAIWEGGFRYEDGVAAATRFLALRERPTAIFASADHAAIGFIRTVRDAGIRIPEDVSIVGFDDIDYASVIDPPLTTMRQPRASLGRLAAEDLLQRMGRDAVDVPPIRERLRCDLIERETVGPVATARSVRRPAKLQREGSGAARGGVT